MKISQEYLENLKNMNLETFKNFVKKDDITEEKMIMLKNEIEKDVNLYNELQNLISKYGLERTPRMLEIIIDEMKIYLKLLTQYEKEASQWQFPYSFTTCSLGGEEADLVEKVEDNNGK